MNHPELLSTRPENLTGLQVKLLQDLFAIKAVRFGEFRLKHHEIDPEAPLSPVYIDLRLIKRHPDIKRVAVEAYLDLISGLKFDLIADIPKAATPFVSTLSDMTGIGMITPQVDIKTHGIRSEIEGLLDSDKGKTVLVADDLISKAESKIEVVDLIESNGLIVTDIVVLIDREQGGKETLAARGIKLHSVLKLSQMMDYYLRVGSVDQETYKRVKEMIQDPSI